MRFPRAFVSWWVGMTFPCVLVNSFHFFFLIKKNFLFLLYFALQYCIGFAIHWHESAMGVHEFPILSTLWIIPVYQPQASCILYRTSPSTVLASKKIFLFYALTCSQIGWKTDEGFGAKQRIILRTQFIFPLIECGLKIKLLKSPYSFSLQNAHDRRAKDVTNFLM